DAVFTLLSILGTIAIAGFLCRYVKKHGLHAITISTGAAPVSTALYTVAPDTQIRDATVERFLREIAGEKPIRFTPQQLSGFTNNYSVRLGAGGFGAVYKGMLPNGLTVAVKRLHAGGHDDRTSQEQFMAEVGTIGRTHHINLVRLFGFCYDAADVRALVYEYMEHGALDSYLFDRSHQVSFQTLRDIAVGSVSGMRGTPGYAAPEMWMQAGATVKCDVYSFGILLFEILGRRRNLDETAPESEQWFPKLVWVKYESGRLLEVVETCDGADEQDKKTADRMCEVAFWCVQQQPEARPPMGVVVKMLEGEMDIAPPANPFQHLMATPKVANM
uniref:Protein kinase domain-containing protein n=1 Tax=Aegilops tauschii subsp. strangulata TaxID=200361 RepID=A0A453TA06_AEGTS